MVTLLLLLATTGLVSFTAWVAMSADPDHTQPDGRGDPESGRQPNSFNQVLADLMLTK